MKRKYKDEAQLSLFEVPLNSDSGESAPDSPPPSEPKGKFITRSSSSVSSGASSSASSSAPTTVLDFVKARFEHGPEMTQEDYKRWIKILVHNSLKSIK